MKKGITPIIAIIVLLLIVVALSGIAYTYISGVLTGQIEESFSIQPSGAFCDRQADGLNNITLIIQNSGTSASISEDSFIVAEVAQPGNATYTMNSADGTTQFETIAPQSTGQITTTCGKDATAGQGCDSGSNTVRLATTANAHSTVVICP